MAKGRPLTKKEKAELKRIKEVQAKKNSTKTPVTNVDTETLKREDPMDRMKRATGQTGVQTMAKGGMAKKGYAKGGMAKKGYAKGGMAKKGYAMGGMMKKGYAKGGPTKKKGAKKGGKVRGVGIARKGFRPAKMR